MFPSINLLVLIWLFTRLTLICSYTSLAYMKVLNDFVLNFVTTKDGNIIIEMATSTLHVPREKPDHLHCSSTSDVFAHQRLLCNKTSVRFYSTSSSHRWKHYHQKWRHQHTLQCHMPCENLIISIVRETCLRISLACRSRSTESNVCTKVRRLLLIFRHSREIEMSKLMARNM